MVNQTYSNWNHRRAHRTYRPLADEFRAFVRQNDPRIAIRQNGQTITFGHIQGLRVSCYLRETGVHLRAIRSGTEHKQVFTNREQFSRALAFVQQATKA